MNGSGGEGVVDQREKLEESTSRWRNVRNVRNVGDVHYLTVQVWVSLVPSIFVLNGSTNERPIDRIEEEIKQGRAYTTKRYTLHFFKYILKTMVT